MLAGLERVTHDRAGRRAAGDDDNGIDSGIGQQLPVRRVKAIDLKSRGGLSAQFRTQLRDPADLTAGQIGKVTDVSQLSDHAGADKPYADHRDRSFEISLRLQPRT